MKLLLIGESDEVEEHNESGEGESAEKRVERRNFSELEMETKKSLRSETLENKNIIL